MQGVGSLEEQGRWTWCYDEDPTDDLGDGDGDGDGDDLGDGDGDRTNLSSISGPGRAEVCKQKVVVQCIRWYIALGGMLYQVQWCGKIM